MRFIKSFSIKGHYKLSLPVTCKQEVATGGVETRPQKPERPGTVLSLYPSAVSSSSSPFESCDILWSDISSGEDPSFKNKDPQDISFSSLQPVFLARRLNSWTNTPESSLGDRPAGSPRQTSGGQHQEPPL